MTTPAPLMAELMPCPFCGARPKLSLSEENKYSLWVTIECLNYKCGGKQTTFTNGQRIEVTKNRALKKWNRRAQL